MKRDDQDKREVQMPFVDPAVAASNPAAAAYAKKMAARLGGDPRGGNPIAIPPLNMPHQPGMTMADQAHAARASAPPQAGPGPGSLFTPQQATQVAQNMAAPTTGILATDLLTEAARQDPAFMEGHGSMYASNQPHLAQKYGVIRQGRTIPPQQLAAGAATRPGLSQKTVEQLAAVQAFNKQREEAESPQAAVERDAADSPAGEAAKLAGGDSPRPVTEADRAAFRDAAKNMDEFDFNSFREIMMKDLLNNDEQKKIIESRLAPIDLSELLMNNRATQRIPVRPGVYEFDLQSMSGQEDIALKRLLMEERKKIDAPDRYILDKFQLMTVACAVIAINGTRLPPHTDSKGDWSDELFWQKFNKVCQLPFHMIASLGVNFYWFDIRVRTLFTAESLKNG